MIPAQRACHFPDIKTVQGTVDKFVLKAVDN